jgi:MerR family transcriptional regulator/heat shock protein HspR
MYANTTSALMQKTGQRLYTIGEAADLIGVSVPTIRMYEREGLIIPLRKASRHRLFAEADLRRIQHLRKFINADKVSIAALRKTMAEIPCWKIMNCPETARATCRTGADAGFPCWLSSGKTWQCKSDECRECKVYLGSEDACAMQSALPALSVGPTP